MANRTKTAIRKAFMDLLEREPLSHITVKDITDECGINRNSFYYHYADIPTLLQSIVAEDSQRIIDEHPNIESLEACLDSAAQFTIANKRAVQHIFNSANRDILEHYLLESCEYVVATYIGTVFSAENIPEYDRNVLIRYYKCTLFGFIIDWINSGLNDAAYQQFRRFIELKKGSSALFIQRSLSEQEERNSYYESNYPQP